MEIRDVVQAGIPGPAGSITPAAQAALEAGVLARDDSRAARDQAKTYRDQAEALTAATQVLQQTAVEMSTYVISSRTAAIDPTGTNDSTAALIAAIKAAPDGVPVRVEKGVYRFNGSASIDNLLPSGEPKAVFDLDFSGSRVIMEDGTLPIVSCVGAFDSTINVTSVTAVEVNTGGDDIPTPGLTLTLDSAPGWVRGDPLHIFAENELPGHRSPDYSAIGSATMTGTQITLDAAPATAIEVGHAVRFSGTGMPFTAGRDYYVTSVQSTTRFTASTSVAGAAISATTATTVAVSRATSIPRVGDQLEVWSVSGSTVTVLGKLWGSYTAGVRVARMRNHVASVRGLDVDCTDARTTVPGNVVMLSRLRHARVENIYAQRTAGPAIVFSACRNWDADGVEIQYGRNDQSNGFLSYAVFAQGPSSNGTLSNAVGRSVRHVYSDDAISTAPGSSPWRYGGAQFNRVRDSLARLCSSTAFDTHQASRGTRFDNLTVESSGGGVQLRGYEHVVTNLQAVDCVIDVSIYEEDQGRNGDTANHSVRGVVSHRNRKRVLSITRRGTNNWNAGVREPRPDYIGGIQVFDPRAAVLYATHSTIVLDGPLSITVRSAMPDDSRLCWPNNSDLRIIAPVYINTREVTVSQVRGLVAFACSGTGSIIARASISLDNVSGVPAVLLTSSAAAVTIQADDVKAFSSGGLTQLDGTFSTRSYVNFAAINPDPAAGNSGFSSLYSSVSSDHANAARWAFIGQSTLVSRMVTVSSLGTGADLVVPAWPAAQLIGQRVNVMNLSSTRGVVVNGVTIPASSERTFKYMTTGWRAE